MFLYLVLAKLPLILPLQDVYYQTMSFWVET